MLINFNCALKVTIVLVLLLGRTTDGFAQGNYGRADLLSLLARGDLSSIPKNQANYFSVYVVLTAIGKSNCALREPKQSLYLTYLPEIEGRFRRLAKTDTPFAQLAFATHPRYLESIGLLNSKGCDSQVVQAVLESGFRFGLGRDPTDFSGALPLVESKSDVYKMQQALVDRYCKYDGRADPACADFLGFVSGKPAPFCMNGMVIPAAPVAPQVISCWYAPLSDQNMGVKYKFWLERTPGNLDAHWVNGKYQMSGIYLVAAPKCPANSVEADNLSQQEPALTEASSVPVSYTYPEPGESGPCDVVKEAPENTDLKPNIRQQEQTITMKGAEEEAGLAAYFAGEYQVTSSGLRYGVVHMGNGAKPTAMNTVRAHYRGLLMDGTEFDSSYARNEPLSFSLNRVIPGWTEGLQLMPVGSKFIFEIPPELAYGEQGGGPIPPNSTLIFEIELLAIEK